MSSMISINLLDRNLSSFFQVTCGLDIRICRVNSIPNQNMLDCVALVRHRTESGTVTFIHSGTGMTDCWKVPTLTYIMFMDHVHVHAHGLRKRSHMYTTRTYSCIFKCYFYVQIHAARLLVWTCTWTWKNKCRRKILASLLSQLVR